MKKNPSQIAGKILAGDLAAIERKVKAGKSLTASERKLVEQTAREHDDEDGTIHQRIATQSQLAAALNLSKQVINHHAKRPDSPRKNPDGSYNLEAWREFILLNGNIQTLARIEAAGDGVAATGERVACHNTLGFFGALTASLHVIISESAKHVGVKLSPAQADEMTLALWQLQAEHLDAYLVQRGLERYFLSRDGDGCEDEIPGPIAKIVLRMNERNRGKKSRAAKRKSPAPAPANPLPQEAGQA